MALAGAEYGEDSGTGWAEYARSCGEKCFAGNRVRSGDSDKNLLVVDLTGLIRGSSSESSAVKSFLLDHLALGRPRDGPDPNRESMLMLAAADDRLGVGNVIPWFDSILLARSIDSSFG